MKITLVSQMMDVGFDPLFIFGVGAFKSMGVAGAAIATSISEVFSAALYTMLLVKRKLVELKDMFKPPSVAALGTLLVGGAGVQLRAVAQNITFLAVMRTILTLDASGTAAAAHTISSQVFQLGVIRHLGAQHHLHDSGPAAHELDRKRRLLARPSASPIVSSCGVSPSASS